MAFVRKKTIYGNAYFYLVRAEKEHQKVMKYIGKNLPPSYQSLYQKRSKK